MLEDDRDAAVSQVWQTCIHCDFKIPPAIVHYVMSRGIVCSDCRAKLQAAADMIRKSNEERVSNPPATAQVGYGTGGFIPPEDAVEWPAELDLDV